MTKRVVRGDEVENRLTGERFTYVKCEAGVVHLESEGQTSRVPEHDFREFFSAIT